MSQEPADPTASSAPPESTSPTIRSEGADVQPEPLPADGDAAAGDDAAAAPVTEATAATTDAPAPDAAMTSDETSAAILAAVTAAAPVAEAVAGAEAVDATPAPEAAVPEGAAPVGEVPEPGAEPLEPVAEAASQGSSPPRRGPWRAMAGVLLLVLLAAALGFGGAFLVPALVDVPVPNGALAPTPTASPTASSTAAPTDTGTSTPSPARSPQSSASAGASSTPRSSSTTYVVQRGDILSAIAARFGVTVQAIVDANGLKDPNHIEPGQRLIIPLP